MLWWRGKLNCLFASWWLHKEKAQVIDTADNKFTTKYMHHKYDFPTCCFTGPGVLIKLFWCQWNMISVHWAIFHNKTRQSANIGRICPQLAAVGLHDIFAIYCRNYFICTGPSYDYPLPGTLNDMVPWITWNHLCCNHNETKQERAWASLWDV